MNEFRAPSPGRTVWEIGGGWGGFAYRVKTLCPAVTYLVTGLPDLFLLSAVYVKTLFPSARVRFYDPEAPDAFWKDWETVDFAFVPEQYVDEIRPPSLGLTLDLGTLERMTPERAARHVERAHQAGSRYFVALLCAGNETAAATASVQSIVERFYWPHPVSAPGHLASRYGVRPSDDGSSPSTYFLGWRRLRV